MLYAVTGATGHTGSVIVAELLRHKQQVRAIGRSADKLKPLVDKGAEAFVANLEDVDGMTRAFAGAQAAYVMIPPNMQAADFRGYQNRVAHAVVAGIRSAGVTHVVMLSSIGAELAEGTGPVTGLHDFEQKLQTLTDRHILLLRPAFFMENTMAMMGLIKSMGINGGATRADVALPWIASEDVGVYAARRLRDLDWEGVKVQYLLGERDLSWEEATKIIGREIERPDLQYIHFSYEDAINGMVSMGLPRNVAESYTELSRAFNEGRIRVETRSAANATPTSFEEFTRKHFAPAYRQ